ncbi:CPBP family intramembrane glutamic endopeptidase [Streptomyces achromogenes]|uniref:CPBP family intramembrane glutamic endopeptidase n=1 Tax=Streptomyces achromogenes TaxID=67255 RepID=UPI0036AFF55D
MTQPPLAEQLPYHRLARITPHHRWWRPLLGTLVVAVGYVFAVLVLMLCALVLGAALGYPEDADGWPEFGPVPGTALDLLSIAVGIPVLLLTVRWIGRRPAGTVSSVTGRLRWRWLGLCVLTAVPVLALAMGGMFLLPADGGEAESWTGWPAFGQALAMLLVLVPLQAAAEEYVFRGWLTQTAGAFLRSPWAALVPQAVLFAAAHGWGTAWGFADLLVFGMCAGWLTWRTGGLEASIALHAVNNLFAFGVSAAVVDGLASDETAADAGWQTVVLDVAGIVLYTAAVTWWLRRRPQERTAPAPPPPAHPYGAVPGPWPVHPYGAMPAPWPVHPYGSVPGPSPVHPYGSASGPSPVHPHDSVPSPAHPYGAMPGQWPGHPAAGAPAPPSPTVPPGAAAPWPGTGRPAETAGSAEDTPGAG